MKLRNLISIAGFWGLASLAVSVQAQTPGEAEPLSASFSDLVERELTSSGGLTAAQVAERAERTSPGLEASRARVLEAAGELDRALSGYVPQLGLAARYTRTSNPGRALLGNFLTAPGAAAGPVAAGSPLVSVPFELSTLQNHYALEAGLVVPFSDYFLRVAPDHAAARGSERAARHSLDATDLDTRSEAVVAYYAWVRARLSALVADLALAQARAHRTDAEHAFAAGSGARADVLRLDAEVAKSELLAKTSSDLAAITEEHLRVLMHDAPNAKYRIGEDVRRALSAAPLAEAGALVQQALSARPEVAALDAEQEAQAARTRRERAGYWPRLQLFARAAYANPNPDIFPPEDEFRGSWAAGAELAWMPSEIAGTAARTSSASARAEELRAEQRALNDRIQEQVFAATRLLEEALGAVGTAERGLTSAEESYRTRRLLYRSGRATTVELLDAETELTSARLALLGVQIETRVARVRLDRALGRVPLNAPGG